MMKLRERLNVLSGIAFQRPAIGKTAMMKCTYFLQEIEKVPLNYSFEIYTYGPYSSEVMEEIDFARQLGLLDIEWEVYPNGMHGYAISALHEATTPYDKQIESVVKEFGSKTAKELELLSTVLFVQRAYKENKWGKDKSSICASVREIKPRFSMEEIADGYEFMKSRNYIQ